MSNPFFTPSTLPFGMPPFAEIRDEHYREAFDAGMAEQLREVASITMRRSMPTFDDTIVALERSGQLLSRVSTVFYNKTSADSTASTDELEEALAPILAGHADAIQLDAALFWRIDQLHQRIDELELDAESRYLLQRYHAEFTIAGAGLGDDEKTRLRDLNQRLSSLTTKFEKNLLADTNDLAVVIDDVAELDGLAPGEISAAAEAAKERGLDGKWLITLVLFTGHPFLASLTRRDVRERIMAASRARGSRGGEWDNTAIVLEITRLRAAIASRAYGTTLLGGIPSPRSPRQRVRQPRHRA